MGLAPYRVKIDQPTLNVLLYGPPGVGKTTVAASVQDHPSMSPVLFASFESGLLSIASRNDIDAVDIVSVIQMDELFWLLRNKTPPYDKYKTIVIDSGSEMQTLALEEARRSEMQKDAKAGKKTDSTIDDLELRTYGKAGAQIARLMRWYRDLPINLIVTALPKSTFSQGADQRTSIPSEVAPQFTNKVGVSIMGYMDMVWYLGREEGTEKRYIVTRNRKPIIAKTRGFNFANALGEIYSNPWLPTIYELLLSSEKGTAKAEHVNSEPVNISGIDMFAGSGVPNAVTTAPSSDPTEEEMTPTAEEVTEIS